MINNKKISLVLPCKNEEAALYEMLQKIPKLVDEIIVVDNNSKDNSRIVAKNGGAKIIRENRHVNGIGYGYAHQSGLIKASGDYIVAMDSDDTYPVEHISNIINYMEKNNLDFVSCNRFPLTNSQSVTFLRTIGVYILNIWVTILYGYYFLDILSGMWVVRKTSTDALNVKSGDWNYSPEIKIAALTNKKINFSEYHISYGLRVNGRSKLNAFKTGLNHLYFIFKMRLSNDIAVNKLFRPIMKQSYSLIKVLLGLVLVKKSI